MEGSYIARARRLWKARVVAHGGLNWDGAHLGDVHAFLHNEFHALDNVEEVVYTVSEDRLEIILKDDLADEQEKDIEGQLLLL